MVLPTCEVIKGKTVIVQAAFRHYDSSTAYVKGCFDFLKKNLRYKQLFVSNDYVAEAHLFQACCYTTDPNYSTVLAATARKYNLTKYNDALA